MFCLPYNAFRIELTRLLCRLFKDDKIYSPRPIHSQFLKLLLLSIAVFVLLLSIGNSYFIWLNSQKTRPNNCDENNCPSIAEISESVGRVWLPRQSESTSLYSSVIGNRGTRMDVGADVCTYSALVSLPLSFRESPAMYIAQSIR